MSRILLYNDTLELGNPAFITPNDKIIIINEKHEVFAQKYCDGNINKLTIEELILYKYWLEQKGFNRKEMSSDFLVSVLGFDKVLTLMKKAIATTSLEPHIRFYNYYLMDWYIDITNRMVYNEKTGTFEEVQRQDWVLRYNEDRKVEEEINKIKSKVKLKDRTYFFK